MDFSNLWEVHCLARQARDVLLSENITLFSEFHIIWDL